MKTTKYNKIREVIKNLSSQQRELKNQRKTVHIKGKRIMDAGEANWKHGDNRYELRHLYQAYAKLKGIEIPKPTKLAIFEFSNSYVDELVKKYSLKKVA